MCPGQKDVITQRDTTTGEKQKLQKHYMLTTLAEAHATFLDENPDAKISLAKFCELRPPQVQLQKDIPHYTCLCKYHENVKLLLQSLSKGGLDIPTGYREFIEYITCDQEQEPCMDGTCDMCPGMQVIDLPQEMAQSPVEWYKWQANDGKTAKVACLGTMEDCMAECNIS